MSDAWKRLGTTLALRLGVVGTVALFLVLVAIAVLLDGLIFQVLWNDFVVRHVRDVAKVSYSGALGTAMLIVALIGSAAASSRSAR